MTLFCTRRYLQAACYPSRSAAFCNPAFADSKPLAASSIRSAADVLPAYVWKEGILTGKIPEYTGEDRDRLSDPQKLVYHFGHRIITRPAKLRCDCMLYNFQLSAKSLAYANPIGEIETIYLIYVSQYKKISSKEIMDLLSELTPREKDVLMLLTEGNDNNQISEKLHITNNTVKSHLQSIYRKLDVTNKTELVTKLYG